MGKAFTHSLIVTNPVFSSGAGLPWSEQNSGRHEQIGPLSKLIFLVLVVTAHLPAQTPRDPDLSGVTEHERTSTESVCAQAKYLVGPAAYRECVEKQLGTLVGSRKPDLSGVAQDDRASIESVCAQAKYLVGPAAYNQCVEKQLSTLVGSRKPDLSGVAQDDRASIESVCAQAKYLVGPAAYNQCIQEQLNELGKTAELRVPNNEKEPTEVSTQVAHSFTSIPTQVASTPSPELQKLKYFLGTWAIEGEIKSSIFGPEGKFNGTHHYEWAADRLSLISRWDENRPGGNDSGKAVYGYDSTQNLYTYHGTDNDGETEDSSGTVEGATWIWLGTPTSTDEQTMNGRFTVKEVSSTSYSFKYEVASQSGEWTTVTEGKATKTK
jgi:hypothetical protein